MKTLGFLTGLFFLAVEVFAGYWLIVWLHNIPLHTFFNVVVGLFALFLLINLVALIGMTIKFLTGGDWD